MSYYYLVGRWVGESVGRWVGVWLGDRTVRYACGCVFVWMSGWVGGPMGVTVGWLVRGLVCW